METTRKHGAVEEFNLPEWETSARHRGEKHIPTATGEGFRDKARGHFNRVMPAHRKYCGLSRKVACIIVLAVSAAIMVLIVGLAAGLSHRSSNHQSLPLGSQTYSGDLTYYGPGLGACGVTSSDSEHIVSISHSDFDAASTGSDPNANPLCGHKLRAIRNGNSVDLTVVDRCVGCKPTDIDVSPGAFKQLADPALEATVCSAGTPRLANFKSSHQSSVRVVKPSAAAFANSKSASTLSQDFTFNASVGPNHRRVLSMDSMPTTVLLLKAEGNTHVKNGKYSAAIECYDEALKRTKGTADAVTLLLNRCHARIESQHYDAALADATVVIDMSQTTPPEKAFFRAARALYGLQRWRECLGYLNQLISLYPSNKDSKQDINRCQMRLREEAGDYDFAAMLKEAVSKSPSPDMDRATYVGPIKVRDCAIKSHGRGIFTTEAVKAGDLLLCERAFAAVFVPAGEFDAFKCGNRDRSDEENVRDFSLSMRAHLVEKTLIKLHRNLSLAEGFSELYAGPHWRDEIDEESGLPLIDESFVQNRIIYNNFGFPILTHEYHYSVSHTPSLVPDDLCGSRGVWIHASYINHSCYPIVRRSFIGDMMIFRAQQNIPADTELKFGYISGLEELDERQSKLKNYGFDCDCQVCEAEKNASGKKMKRRMAISGEIVDIFEKGESNSLQTYTNLLDQMEATYVNPPSVEYRRAMITPLTNLITGCLTSGLPLQVIELVHRLLLALGFEIEVTMNSFRVLQWGFLIDEIVVSLVDLCDAYADINPRLLADAEGVAKKCYLIMCGEDVTWEEAYGRDKKTTGTRSGMGMTERTEDLVEGGEGLKFV